MSTKQFKIGEYCMGGIIQVNIQNSIVLISALDYSTKQIIMSRNFNINDRGGIDEYLNDLTSCYYADNVLNYINSKIS